MKYSFTSLLILLSLSVAAGTFKGKITDKQGQPLSFAIVFIKGTTIGTSANADGVFVLEVPDGNHTAIAQYMGYQQSQFPLSIKGNEIITHNFSLAQEELKMKEYVVKSTDDPAVYIMRKVIARRKFHLNQIKTFETGIYAKATVRSRDVPKSILGMDVSASDMGVDSSGKGILSQFEEQATYYTQDGKEKTVIHSVRESGNPNGLGFSQFPEVINFYQNNIQISTQIDPRGMISPVSDGALGFYKYKLEGDFKEGNHTVYKISVTPKRLYEPLFTGTLYIIDDEWGIHSLNLQATQTANIQMVDTIRINQAYIPLKKDEWVIKHQGIFFNLKLMGFDLVGNIVTVYNNQKINGAIPDSIFNKKIVSEYDRDANKKDSSYWNQYRYIPLEEDEVKDYFKKDSIRLVEENPLRLDSLRRRNNRFNAGDLLSNGYSYRSKHNNFSLSTNALLTGIVNFNTLEGWNVAPRISMRKKIDSFRNFNGIVALRYGFSNTHFNAIARVNYVMNHREWQTRGWLFGVEGGSYVFQFNPYNPIPPFYNTVSTLFYRKNYLKLYERVGGSLFINRNFGNGFTFKSSFQYQQRHPLQNTDFTSFAKTNVGGFTDNLPTELIGYHWQSHHAAVIKLSASYQPGFTYVKYPDFLRPMGSDYPTISISYEKGIPNIFNSKTDFDKWRIGVRDDIELRLLGNLGYHVAVGGFLNSRFVGIPDLNHIQGNQLGVATSYLEGFQVAPYYAFSNHERLYGEAHAEWQLRGFLTNKIPLFRNLSWYLVAGGNAYYVNPSFYHVEAFVGLDNLGYSIYRFFRIDYVRGWNNFGQPIHAVRVGISSNSILQLPAENTSTEW